MTETLSHAQYLMAEKGKLNIFTDKGLSMRIKSFQVGGHTVTVKYMKAIQDSGGRNLFGVCNPKTDMIHIATIMDGAPIAEDVIIHSVYHELAHYFMITMYEHKLNANEKFIDNLGLLLHQFMKTKK